MSPFLADLSDRAMFCLHGPDRTRFLNGQVSNNVRDLKPGKTLAACVMTAKGKMNGLIWIVNAGSALQFDVEAELRESIHQRLERYMIADEVELQDVTGQFALFHLAGATGDMPEGATNSRRFGIDGHDFLVPKDAVETMRANLEKIAPILPPSELEKLRITLGIPKWEKELGDATIPVEAGLEEATIDYNKGCYIGQEVISRIKSVGQVARKLRGLVPIDGAPLPLNAPIFSEQARPETRPIGSVTSATFSPWMKMEIGLGFIKRTFAEPGMRVWLEQNAVLREVEVRELPFLTL